MSEAIKYPEVYTVEEFAGIFKVSPESVRNLIRKGEISAIKIGKQYRISKTVVDRYFAQVATPEESGFGMWKEAPVDSLEYVNKLRDKDKRTPEKFLEDVRSGNSG
jgi:excisionase family DNA binding protein